MNPRAYSYFEQLPPTWDRWFDALRLLIKHGAEVHETVNGRNLASLNIERDGLPSKTLDFLRLLAAEDALQLDVMSGCDGWPALHTALVCDSTAVDALKVLSSSGIQLSKVMDNGKSALHVSARLSASCDALEYLCAVGCSGYINRQDQWGWTPLHYAVASRNSAEVTISHTPYAKVLMLLQKGANPTIRSSQNAMKIYGPLLGSFTAYEFLRQVRPARFKMLVEVLRHAGIKIGDEEEEDVFYEFE